MTTNDATTTTACDWCHVAARTVAIDAAERGALRLCVPCTRQARAESERYSIVDFGDWDDAAHADWMARNDADDADDADGADDADDADVIEPDALAAQTFAADYFRTLTPGIVFDGQHGQTYNDGRVFQLAERMGWNRPAIAPIDADECAYDAAEALDYVNAIGEHYGMRLDWEDGDLLAARIYETLTICACCMSMLANDDESGCRDYYGHADGEGGEHPHGLCAFIGNPWRDGWHVTPGIMAEEHATDCPIHADADADAWPDVECECHIDDCSLATCDGCGANAHGYAHRELVTATKYTPHDAR